MHVALVHAARSLSPYALANPHAECFYLGAMDCLVSLWCAAGAQGGPALQEALRRAELRAKSNVWPMVSRALAQQAQLQSA